MPDDVPAGYTPAFLGSVSWLICNRCGSLIVRRSDFDAVEIHDNWHRGLNDDSMELSRLSSHHSTFDVPKG